MIRPARLVASARIAASVARFFRDSPVDGHTVGNVAERGTGGNGRAAGGLARLPRVRVAVLASGSGTLLDSILAAEFPVSLVVVDRACRAEQVAADHGVECVRQDRTDFSPSFDRSAFSLELASLLSARSIELVAMAGYGTILDAAMHESFPGRIINTHPALLPSFPGWHAVRDALAYGVKVTGCTIHIATIEVDAGPILAQEAVPVLDDDDES
ncbi:MAG: phosphoribosylglycinamide formyltransferase [Actinobacteria bacterium]|nr:phosphoribosylglycinamide formyltransferase [Actinomycetota bacterium]